MSATPTRPILRYHGGKWRLAPWIIQHMPKHRCYVEPFGGAASVLIRKARSHAEVYNDLDGEIVNLFRVVRGRGQELRQALLLTPFAREEFVAAWQPIDDPLEQARRTVIRAFMGFGSAAVTMKRNAGGTRAGLCAGTGFRANSNQSGTTPAHDWANYPKALDSLIERLQGVVIENRDALEVMSQHDAPTTLHYCDPPYVASTRDAGSDYAHEMTNEQHAAFLDYVKTLSGMVMVSGYPDSTYDVALADWRRIEREALADGAKKRTEVLWLSPNCITENELFQAHANA